MDPGGQLGLDLGAQGGQLGGVPGAQFGQLGGGLEHVAWAGTVSFRGELEGHFATGSTDAQAWSRTQLEAAAGFGSRGWTLGARTVLGQVAGGTGFDAYRLGGMRSTLIPDLAQQGHVLVPMFEPGAVFGEERQSVAVELDIQGTVASWQCLALGDTTLEWVEISSHIDLEPTPLVGIPAVDVQAGASCTLANVDGRVEKPCTHLADYAAWAALVWRP